MLAVPTIVGLLFCNAADANAAAHAGPTVSFTKEIAPLFVQNCVACHNQTMRKGKYDLSSHAAALRPGKSGASILPGKAADSLLVRMIAGEEDPAMPKDADLLDPREVAKIRAWVMQGAKFDGPNASVDLRDLVDGRAASTPVEYTTPTPTTALAFSPDGKELAASGYREITFWSPSDGRLLRRLPTRGDRIHVLQFSVDGSRLLHAGGTPGRMGEVVLWDLKAGRPLREFFRTSDVVFAAALSPDGKQAAAGGTDRALRIWEVATGKELFKVENHSDWVLGLAYAADGKRLLTASRDKSAKVWDQTTRELTVAFFSHTDAVYAIEASLDGQSAWSVGADKQLRFWKTTGDGEQKHSEFAHEGGAFALKRTPDGKRLVTGGADKRVKIWRSDGGLERQLEGHSDWVYSVAVSADGKWGAGGAWDGEVRVWELATGKLVTKFIALPAVVKKPAKPAAPPHAKK